MGRNAKDLTDMKFGKLTARYRVEKPEEFTTQGVYWYCDCECGGSIIKISSELTRKRNKNQCCGRCLAEDLTNKKFNHLTAKYRGENTKFGQVRWWCECDCGNTNLVLVFASHLKDGHTKSCGCIQSDSHRKYNTYDLTREYGIGYTAKGEEFYFDLEDYDKIKDYCWYKNEDGYIVTEEKRHGIYMHRLIMSVPNDVFIDHLGGKKTRCDNRKYNLRNATKSQNGTNTPLRKNNTSGITGVQYDKRRDRWCAYISVNNKSKFLGSSKNKEDVIRLRKEAEEKYYKEYSYKNSIKLFNIKKENNDD